MSPFEEDKSTPKEKVSTNLFEDDCDEQMDEPTTDGSSPQMEEYEYISRNFTLKLRKNADTKGAHFWNIFFDGKDITSGLYSGYAESAIASLNEDLAALAAAKHVFVRFRNYVTTKAERCNLISWFIDNCFIDAPEELELDGNFENVTKEQPEQTDVAPKQSQEPAPEDDEVTLFPEVLIQKPDGSYESKNKPEIVVNDFTITYRGADVEFDVLSFFRNAQDIQLFEAVIETVKKHYGAK